MLILQAKYYGFGAAALPLASMSLSGTAAADGIVAKVVNTPLIGMAKTPVISYSYKYDNGVCRNCVYF